MTNINMWLIIFAVLVILAVIVFGMVSAFTLPTTKPFHPQVAGQIARVNGESIVQFITEMNPDQVRALLFIDPQVYRNKKSQLQRSMQLYSLIDQRLFPQIYEKIFKSVNGDIAKSDDLGGILLSHYNKKRLEIYTMSAIEEGEPIQVANQQFNSKRHAADAVRQFYNSFRGIFGEYLVVIISGPNLTDLDNMAQTQISDPALESDGETPLPDDDEGNGEEFGMYESALVSWLSPRGSAVGHYTRRPVLNQGNYVNTVNTNVPTPPTDIPFTNARLQTPTHSAPKVNPGFDRLIRKK